MTLQSEEQRTFTGDGCTIVWGDCIEMLDSVVEDGSVNLIFADPPYNIGKRFGDEDDKWPSDDAYLEWCKRWVDLCVRKLAPNGSVYLMTSTQAMPGLDLYVRTKLEVLSRIVWSYDSSGVQARRYFGSLWEPILFAVANSRDYTFNSAEILVEARTGAKRKLIDYRGKEPKEYSSTKVPGNVWEFPRVRYRMPEYEEHPTQKPEALLERIVRASSNPGDLVLDPFAGSGTTGAVAKRLGRRFVGIEKQEPYVGIALRRLGLSTSLNGIELKPVAKNTKRVNGASLRAASIQDELDV